MIDISRIDYSAFDNPLITRSLFYPRPEWGSGQSGGSSDSILIPVEKDVVIGARFHKVDKSAANILFFHGNGEIAADYNDMGIIYNDMAINFLPVDYRGYGLSTGRPTVTAMMRDCHVIFEYVQCMLRDSEYVGPLIVMGRSLGSISACELAFHYRDRIDGLIIESGLAYAGPLLSLLGIDMKKMGLSEDQGFQNLDKIGNFDKPALIIHAEHDHIISFSEGQRLFSACPSHDKRLLKIYGANHNDIFMHGMSEYLDAITWLVAKSRDVKIR